MTGRTGKDTPPMNINNIRFGYVTGRVVVTTNDAADPGYQFDEIAPSGWVYLTPRANAFAGAHRDHAIIFPDRMSLPVDSEGYVTVPSPTGQPTTQRTIEVPVEPGMTWQVSADLTIPAYPWQEGVEHNRVILHPFDVPVVEEQTTDLADYLPKGIDPDTGAVWLRGRRGVGLDDIRAENGQLIFEWNDDRTTTIDVPDAVQGEPGIVEDASVADVIRTGTETNTALRQRYLEARPDVGEDEVQLGPELITSTGWSLGTGWTGSLAEGFAHGEGGGPAPLTWEHGGLDTAKTYLLQFTVDSPTANSAFDPEAFTLTIGGQSMSPIYQGGGTVTSYKRAFTPTSQDPLVLTPLSSSRVMTILGVSLQEVTAPATATSVWRDSTGQVGAEFRTTGSRSQFLGTDSGRFHVGSLSVGVGTEALRDDVSGFFNVAVGAWSLRNAQRVSRNVAVGYRSLENNIMADRNVAVGPFSGHTLTTGNENTLVGVDTMWQTENSSRNVAVGLYALDRADNVHNSIGIGRHSLKRAYGGVENIGIGSYALKLVRGNRNVAIGELAAEEMTTATSTVAIGGRALRYSSTANGQIGIGYETAQHSNGEYNVAIGQRALEGVAGQTTGRYNVAIGLNSGRGITTGSRNIMIGRSAGSTITTGSHNILIGDGVNQPVTGDYVLNIGWTLIGDLERRNIGVEIESPTARLHLPAGDGSPRSAPLKIAPGGALLEAPEPGAMEYANGNLYFTTGNGRFLINMTAV